MQHTNSQPVQQPSSAEQAAGKKRFAKDAAIRRIITGFGLLVLITFTVLVWQLVSQALPLLGNASLEHQSEWSVPEDYQLLSLGDIQQSQSLMLRQPDCSIAFANLNSSVVQQTIEVIKTIPSLCQYQVRSVRDIDRRYLAQLSNRGLLRVDEVIQSRGQVRHQQVFSVAIDTKDLEASDSVPSLSADVIERWNIQLSERWAVVSAWQNGSWMVFWIDRQQQAEIYQYRVVEKHIVALPNTGQLAAYEDERLVFYDRFGSVLYEVELEAGLHNILPLTKSRSMMVNTIDGKIQKWSLTNQGGAMQYQPLYTAPMTALLTHAMSSNNTNAGILVNEQGHLWIFNRVTGEVSYEASLGPTPDDMLWRDDRLLTAADGKISQYRIDNIEGVTTFNELFNAQRYEGYEQADTVWQTSSASDFHELKFNIMPLLIGSLKAALLALVIAIPLALGAAIYTAYFAPGYIREWLKPSIEMLEAIPSVIIGFIAAIWLAPLAERFLLSLAAFLIMVPLLLVALSYIQYPISKRLPPSVRHGWEMYFSVIALLFVGWLSLTVVPDLIATLLPQFDTQGWQQQLATPLNKNTLVVAIALGIAISPSIYTLAEDAINGVPRALTHASFALGATRLQTLRRVVLAIALPGILSAVILGFGRAFGETMIVLMVTGNTPVADWSIFSSLRSLTANLAIELPESETGSVHYRVLFLTALLLFTFTFIINTIAEILRQRFIKSEMRRV